MNYTRKNKGKSLIELPDRYCCIDVETTGYMPKFDNIIEFCGVKVSNGKIIKTYSTLIKPSTPVSEFITDLTGITNDMLENKTCFEGVANNIYQFLENEILLGHNIHFDINFLYDNFKITINKNLENDFVDLLRLSRRLFKNFENHKLVTVAEELGVTSENWHRARADCDTTIKCFERCRKYIIDNNINIKKLFKRKRSKNRNRLRAKDITPKVNDFDIDHPLYNKVCVFTGKLDKMKRRQAMQYVVNLGGKCKNNMSRNVDFLILGDNDYCSTIKDGKSRKQKKAESLILKGYDLKIIPERIFYEMIKE